MFDKWNACGANAISNAISHQLSRTPRRGMVVDFILSMLSVASGRDHIEPQGARRQRYSAHKPGPTPKEAHSGRRRLRSEQHQLRYSLPTAPLCWSSSPTTVLLAIPCVPPACPLESRNSVTGQRHFKLRCRHRRGLYASTTTTTSPSSCCLTAATTQDGRLLLLLITAPFRAP